MPEAGCHHCCYGRTAHKAAQMRPARHTTGKKSICNRWCLPEAVHSSWPEPADRVVHAACTANLSNTTQQRGSTCSCTRTLPLVVLRITAFRIVLEVPKCWHTECLIITPESPPHQLSKWAPPSISIMAMLMPRVCRTLMTCALLKYTECLFM